MTSNVTVSKYSKMASQVEINQYISQNLKECTPHFVDITGTILESFIRGDLSKLKNLLLKEGFPEKLPILRALAWKIFLGYLPSNSCQWEKVLVEQREKYQIFKEVYLKAKLKEYENKTYENKNILELISNDINRTYFQKNFFNQPTHKVDNVHHTQPIEQEGEKSKHQRELERLYGINNHIETHADVLTRILFIYSQLVPDVSYNQGMNEILSPIYFIFSYDQSFEYETLENVEADSFWAFFNLINQLRSSFDHTDKFCTMYKGEILEKALLIIDKTLAEHLERNEFSVNMVSCKWFIPLLSQSIKGADLIRLWDIVFMKKNKYYYLFYACLAIFEIKKTKLLNTQGLTPIVSEIQNMEDINIDSLIKTIVELKEQYNNKIGKLFYPPNT